MNDKKLIHGIFHPDNDDENNRCWKEILPYVSDGVLSSQAEYVVDMIGEKLQFMLDFMKLESPRDYYRYYLADLWEHLRKNALTYNKNITDMAGVNAFLNKYVGYFALDTRKKYIRKRDIEQDFDSVKEKLTPSCQNEDVSDIENDAEDDWLDNLMEEVEDYVDHLNPNEVMAQYLAIITNRMEQKVENDKKDEKDERKAREKKEKKIRQYQNYIEDLYAFYVRGLTLEEIAKEKHVTVKYMGMLLKRARIQLVEFLLPEIRRTSREHFIWLQEHYFDRDNSFLKPKEIVLLNYFFVKQFDLQEIAEKMKIKKDLCKIFYGTLRKYYKIKVKIYTEHQHAMRGIKATKDIDIFTFEQSLLNKK